MNELHIDFHLIGPLLKPSFSFSSDTSSELISLGLVKWSSERVSCNLIVDNYNKSLLLSGPSFTDEYPELKSKATFQKRHLSILKSQMQKCARRSKIDIGLKTAVSMILIENEDDNHIRQMGLFELLRRMTIIIIEDTVLSESYSFLVWSMMVLTKGHTLNSYAIEKILEIIKGALSSGFRDPSSYKFTTTEDINIRDMIKLCIDKPEIMSMLIRSCYKGMTCDQNMLLSSSKTWSSRYTSHSPTIKYLKINCHIPINKFEQLQKTDIQPESLDFHCTNIVERIKKYIEMDSKKIERLIWYNQSSINNRVDVITNKIINNDDDKDWNSIKLIFQMESKNLIHEL